MKKIEMVIDSIRVALINYQRVVLLREKGGKRYLPIWVGTAEADAIAFKMQNISVPRPLTHDLLCSIANVAGLEIRSAVMNKIENDTYYAKLVLTSRDKSYEIDCRPSDALAVALRVDAPILADEEVLSKAGIPLDLETGKLFKTEAALGKEVKLPAEPPPAVSHKLERFSESVREIFDLAEKEAKRLGSNYIGTDHLLLALVLKAPNTATMILANLGVYVEKIIAKVGSAIGEEQPSEADRVTLSLNARRTIELCVKEASRLTSQQVLSEHLLISMIRERKGIAGKILRGLGINVERVYAELIRRLNSQTQD